MWKLRLSSYNSLTFPRWLRHLLPALVVAGLASLTGCGSIFGSDEEPEEVFSYRFDNRPQDWSALFSNYTPGREDDFELDSGYRSLPAPLDSDRVGFMLTGRNLSDDLNMFLIHRIDDLPPSTDYEVTFEVAFATDAPSGCAGVGGAPGESVTVHAEVSQREPQREIDASREQEYYRLNLAEEYEGEEPNWYRDTEIGDVANSRDCEQGREYEIKELESDSRRVTSSEEGSVWLLVGTRSGFEATTTLFYSHVTAYFSER